MKVCLIANPNSIHTQRWIEHLSGTGIEFHLVGEHPLESPLPPGVKFYDLARSTNLRKVRYLVWGLLVRRIVRQVQPEVLHGFSLASAGWLAVAAGYHPLLVTALGSDLNLLERKGFAHQRLTRWVLRRADRVTAVSQGLLDLAVRFGVEPNKTQVAMAGIDTEVFCPVPRPGNPAPPKILSLRAMKPIYHPLDIAQAFKHIAAEIPSARLLVPVYSPDLETLRQFKEIIATSGLSGQVDYLEPVTRDPEIALRLQTAEVAISVAASDGTPMSVLEAMACGTPLVAGDTPAIRAWVEDSKEGIIVPLNDPEAIASATVQLLRNAGLRQRLGEAAAARVQASASRKACRAHSLKLYHEVAVEGRRQ